jgi:hypothetical protein
MADFKWYYENVGFDTWIPFDDYDCKILNDFHSKNIESEILDKKTLIKVYMKELYIYDESHKRIKIKKITYDEKVNIEITKFLYSDEIKWFEHRNYRYKETTLNELYQTNLDGLFKVKCYNDSSDDSDEISNLEDLKFYLLKYNNTGFEKRLITSMTLETLPDLTIKLFLINSYFGSYRSLVNASLALISSENPVQFDTDIVIFYRVGYLNNEAIIGLTKKPSNIFFAEEANPLFIYKNICVTKDYGKVLYLLNEIEKANCIFEFHFTNKDTLQNVVSLDKYCEDNICMISVMSYFMFEKIIKQIIHIR